MQDNDVEVNEEERFLNWAGLFLIVVGVIILFFQGPWIAVGVTAVVVGNNYRLVSVIRAGMRHMANTTVASLLRLMNECFGSTKDW